VSQRVDPAVSTRTTVSCSRAGERARRSPPRRYLWTQFGKRQFAARERERERTLVHARAHGRVRSRSPRVERARARPELSTRAYPLIKFIGFAKSRARAPALVRAWDTARCKSRPVIVPRQRYREPYGALFANKTRMGIKARRRVRVNSYRVASAVKPSNCLLKS